MNHKLTGIMQAFLQLFAVVSYIDGVGRFDSVDGAYDANTSFAFNKALYYQANRKSLIANLPNQVVGAYEKGDISPVIDRTRITEGDMVRFTLEDNIRGKATYGDSPVIAGGFLQFKNLEARVNNIDSPAIQIVGKMSQQRVRQSIENLPAKTRTQIITFMNQQKEFEAIDALIQGGSSSVMKSTADGGLGISLGVGSGAGAGVPLMNKHWFTPETGFCTYSTIPATYNAAVNDAIGGIDAVDADKCTLAYLNTIREKMDDIMFEPIMFLDKNLRAIAVCDPQIMWRIGKTLLADVNKYSMERGKTNPFWSTVDIIVIDEVAYISWPNLKKYRPSNNGTTGVRGPNFGPLTADSDPRTYTTTSSNGMIIYMGGGALKEGFNDEISVTEEKGRHDKGLEVAAHMMEGFIRGEFYSKDGRADSTDNVENRSVICAAFYEPGVGL
jgi:hypothetical protein